MCTHCMCGGAQTADGLAYYQRVNPCPQDGRRGHEYLGIKDP